MIKYIITIIFSLFLLSCDSKHEISRTVIVWDKHIQNMLNNYQHTFNRKRTMIEFDNGQSANNCAEYLQISKTATIKEEIHQQAVKSEYLECEALALLGNIPLDYKQDVSDIGRALAARLDLRSFNSSLYQKLDDTTFTLAQLNNDSLKIGSLSATFETDTWHYKLTTIAVGDINGDTKNDWVIWLTDEAKTGSYRNYQTLIVFNPEPTQANLTATPYSPALNK